MLCPCSVSINVKIDLDSRVDERIIIGENLFILFDVFGSNTCNLSLRPSFDVLEFSILALPFVRMIDVVKTRAVGSPVDGNI